MDGCPGRDSGCVNHRLGSALCTDDGVGGVAWHRGVEAGRGAAAAGDGFSSALGLMYCEKCITLKNEIGVFPDPGKSKVWEPLKHMLAKVFRLRSCARHEN